MGIGIVELSILGVVFVFWICGNILRKAGYSRWLSLLLLVPLLNLAFVWIFAFARWPAAKGATANRPN
jgi:hypothetical protein